jgi:predicted aspartyl protease
MVPVEIISKMDRRKMSGIKKMQTKYHCFLSILLKSKILLSSLTKPVFQVLRNVRIEADVIGVTVRRAI